MGSSPTTDATTPNPAYTSPASILGNPPFLVEPKTSSCCVFMLYCILYSEEPTYSTFMYGQGENNGTRRNAIWSLSAPAFHWKWGYGRGVPVNCSPERGCMNSLLARERRTCVGTRFSASATMACRWGAWGWGSEACHRRSLDTPALRSVCLLAYN